MTENEIATLVLDSAFSIHRKLGPGLFESVYKSILVHELDKRYSLFLQKEVPIPIVWNEIKLELGFRADIIVENKLLVELKSVESIAPVHTKQVLTYLRLTDLRLGLLINFNEVLLKNGIHRIVNNLYEHP